MKGIRIGRRRTRTEQAASPLELALRPAVVDGRWHVPDRFNFTRDVVEVLASDLRRNAVTVLGSDGVIEPRTFLEIAESATGRAETLTEHGVQPKDRVILMADTSVHWLELMLGIWKMGAVAVPVLPRLETSALEALYARTTPALVVAEHECSSTIEQLSFEPEVLYVGEEPRKRGSSFLKAGPTHDTAARDLALLIVSQGGEVSSEIGHTHAAVFAARVPTEHWLDAGPGDVVWCTASADSPLATWFTLAGPWSRGAEAVIQHGAFDPQERLEHIYRIGPTILCQSAAEYRALAKHEKLERFRPPRLRQLVSTGDVLDPEVVEVFQERWELAIHDGYGQAETSIVIAHGDDDTWKLGSIGRPLPGYEIAIIDDQGDELPNGIEGDLAIRGHPPTLFAGYWEAPDDTKRAFRGDLYVTGDVATADEEGSLTFLARAEDVITSSGRTFGPHEIEYVLRSHPAITASAVVGIRDLQRGGHFVRAFVVPIPGLQGTEQLQAELRQFVGELLPEQQVPREIVFVDELPTFNGRPSRSTLRERPLVGRPLWDMPPTSEPVAPASPPAQAPPPRPPDPPVLRLAEAAQAAVPAAEPTVVEPAPIPPAPEPVAAAPVAEPVLVPEPVPVEPVVAAAPAAEPVFVPEPVPVEPVASEPVAPPPTPEPAHVSDPVTPSPAVDPEPVIREEPRVPSAEVAATEPTSPPQPAEPTREQPRPEPEPVRAPELRIVSQPEVQEDTSVHPPGEQGAAASEPERPPAPVTPPEPAREYATPSDSVPERVAAPPPTPREPAPAPDHDPLPDYIVDPDRPPAPRPPEPEVPRVWDTVQPAADHGRTSPDDASGAGTAGVYFPPVTSFPPPREDDDDDPSRSDPRKAPRRRPAPEPGKTKSKRSHEEPGDDTADAGWMEGLSNRLSAYSFTLETDQTDAAPGTDDPDTEGGEPSSPEQH